MKAGLLLAAAILAALTLAACDDFNRPLKEETGFYLDLTPVSTWAELEAAAQKPATKIIAVTRSFPAEGPATIPINHALTITAMPGVAAEITRQGGFNDSFFDAGTNGRLTLGHPLGGFAALDGGGTDSNGDGYTDAVTDNDSLVKVSGGVLILRDGAALRNNGKASVGGIIYGGAVRVQSGSFEMNGGTISGNTWAIHGGGVYVGSAGRFIMNGGTIGGNKTSPGNGSGVYVAGGGDFTMKGGTIGGNSGGQGSGVYVYGGDFTMSGGTISGNSNGYRGGGVGVVSSGSFTMKGGTISQNSTSDSFSFGGGVFVDGTGSIFTMDGGTISGNTTGGYGGGVCVSSGGGFTMDRGTIGGNTAAGNGGGVSVYYGTNTSFDMSGGTISGNTAAGNGGGVHVYNGGFTMDGGTVSGNTAAASGGGVFVDGGSFTKAAAPGCIIYGSGEGENTNTADSGNGHAAYVNDSSKKRNSTAGPDIGLDSGTDDNWD
jgi:hypothetical protein